MLHSGLSARQRLDAWHQIRAGLSPIVIGARSAVFAPIPRLGTIVVDEEHDGSFKQEDGVRYHARDVALVRARDLGIGVVLGSATPSLETYAHAQRGKYSYIALTDRPTPRPLPEVEIVSLATHKADPETLITGYLADAIAENGCGARSSAVVPQSAWIYHHAGLSSLRKSTAVPGLFRIFLDLPLVAQSFAVSLVRPH